ncbi:hypothetical protein GUITHDRAFT_143930 [Guillardia theta CCMP2712]|uniref:Ubiquitin-like domain-containing protein n=1 Tax=Guillardia theta (strain CCMP2712) TaxID=905079 RepID=L1IRP3_GUITC|nr:hypothetical protein GUITHDRAFT_143930 [Guillardia theta CCMP2712]EKX38936.1 hypothetical protein GUITHDRAFT_143930 [Guillardia theta CCMP2712]|eukprot:XP_005825916.1 hypothetical protein GUITHDRAFT_143930 [Guillardia theta CCMP2712]
MAMQAVLLGTLSMAAIPAAFAFHAVEAPMRGLKLNEGSYITGQRMGNYPSLSQRKQKTSLLRRMMMLEGRVSVTLKRNMGGTFFFAGEYMNDEREKPRTWLFQRTWKDFSELDSYVRPRFGSKMDPLPPEPYIFGEEANPGPFQSYIKKIIAIEDAFGIPEVYEFCEAPADVVTAAYPDRVPIDVDVVKGKRRYQADDRFSVPVMDPVMIAAQAGKNARVVKDAISSAELSKKAGQRAAEWKQEADSVAGAVSQVVNASSTGKLFGSVLGNLRSGRGLFGEEVTMKAVSTISGAVEEIMDSDEVEYSERDKWDLVIYGGDDTSLEVTVKPTQKCKLLVKAWCNEVGVDDIGSYQAERKGKVLDLDSEIGAAGVKNGSKIRIVKKS